MHMHSVAQSRRKHLERLAFLAEGRGKHLERLPFLAEAVAVGRASKATTGTTQMEGAGMCGLTRNDAHRL